MGRRARPDLALSSKHALSQQRVAYVPPKRPRGTKPAAKAAAAKAVTP